jgi:DNA repair and recombination protein RAD52
MFTPEQNTALAGKLSSSAVKSRKQGGSQVQYIEGWHAIAEANRIFGFDKWTRETLEIRCVSEKEREIGTGKTPGWGVTYIIKCRIIADGVAREGCGAGHGIDRDLGQAHESAIKEAETDAMKRAFMTFGNPFGLALYDKDRNNVADEGEEIRIKFIAACAEIIRTSTNAADLREWWSAEAQKKQRRDFDLSKPEVDGLLSEIKAKLETLEQKKAA